VQQLFSYELIKLTNRARSNYINCQATYKSKIFKFLKRDCSTIHVAEIISGKIEIFSKCQRFLIATESSKYLLIFVLYVCVILWEFGTAISKRYACFCCLFKIIMSGLLLFSIFIWSTCRNRRQQ
jgi:hypothetical protein